MIALWISRTFPTGICTRKWRRHKRQGTLNVQNGRDCGTQSAQKQFSRSTQHIACPHAATMAIHLRDGVPIYASPHTVHLQPLQRGAKDPRCTPRQQLIAENNKRCCSGSSDGSRQGALQMATASSPSQLSLRGCGRCWREVRSGIVAGYFVASCHLLRFSMHDKVLPHMFNRTTEITAADLD